MTRSKKRRIYKLKPDPALLYNAAQAYRMTGNNHKALLLCKNYVMFFALGAISLLGCGSSASPPGTFGVNLTIDIDATLRSQVTGVALHVTGDETYNSTLDLVSFSGGEARVHYVPAVHSGVV